MPTTNPAALFCKRHKFCSPFFFFTIILVLFVTLTIFYNLGAYSLRGLDEAYTVQIVKSSFSCLNSGIHGTDKLKWQVDIHDPMHILLTAAAFMLFGESEFFARLFPAIFGVLTLWITYLFANSLFKNRKISLISVFILITSYAFVYNRGIRAVDGEIILTFFLLVFLFFIWKGIDNAGYFYLSSIFLGLAALSKTPCLQVVIAFLIAILFQVFSNKLRSRKEWFIWFVILFTTLLPWLVYLLFSGKILEYLQFFILVAYTNLPIFGFFKSSLMDKFAFELPHYIASMYFYVIEIGFFPWSLILFPTIILAFKNIFSKNREKQNILILTWITVVVLFMTVASSHKTWWINYTFPGLAILVARFIYDIWSSQRAREVFITFVVSWLAAILIICRPIQIIQSQYSPVPFLEISGIRNGLTYSIESNVLLIIFLLTLFIFIFQEIILVRFKFVLVVKDFIKKAVIIWIFIIAANATFNQMAVSNFKSDMHSISDMLNVSKIKLSEIVLCDLNLLEIENTLIPHRNELWSDSYYLRRIKFPFKEISKEDLLRLAERKDYFKYAQLFISKRKLISEAVGTSGFLTKLNIIFNGNDYCLFSFKQ